MQLPPSLIYFSEDVYGRPSERIVAKVDSEFIGSLITLFDADDNKIAEVRPTNQIIVSSTSPRAPLPLAS